jgi:cephalosporin hydroxylase
VSLYQNFLNNAGRPIHKSLHYFTAYERHFGRFVGNPLLFLEIGAGNGGSSQMWKAWFGPLARIVTVDINPICLQYADEQVAVRIGDQSDPGFLQALIDEFGVFDAVLDDGSHQMPHVAASFDYLYPRISASGVYMVEDLHTAYWPDYGGGYRAPASFIERFKGLVDELNADHVRDGHLAPTDFTRSTYCMSAYDSIVVFEKSPILAKHMVMLGDQERRANY